MAQIATTTTVMQHANEKSSTESPLRQIVLARHSTRVFHKTPVPMPILEECLAIAQTSPSSTNTQPWRMVFTSGPRLERLRKAMMDAVVGGQKSTVPPIPDSYRHYRSELGHQMYGPEGYDVPREDKDKYHKAERRNYVFFDAPLVAVIGMENQLTNPADILGVGLYTQTLTLLLQERGVGSCIEVSTSGYADVIRKGLDIPDNIMVLSTIAIGYEDESDHLNTLRQPRDTWKQHVTFSVDE